MRTVSQVLTENGVKLDSAGCGKFNGRNIRYLHDIGKFQVGDDNFDRWANSVDFEIDVYQKKGLRALARWLTDFE